MKTNNVNPANDHHWNAYAKLRQPIEPLGALVNRGVGAATEFIVMLCVTTK
jgi:hypothetical protein